MNDGDAFGFSALPPRVASEVAAIYGHHRTPWFEGVLDEIGDLLRPALGGRFTPLFLTCTSSGGREATVANLVRPSDRVLANGSSYGALARAWGGRVQDLSAATSAGTEAQDSVFIEHVLPDGSLVDVNAIVAAVRGAGPDTPIVLDASVSFGSDFWDAQPYDVDALLIVPERALMAIPGVAVLAVTDRLIETVTRRRSELAETPFLYDILRYRRAASKHTTPYSPNISACVALHAALCEIHSAGGLRAHQDSQARRAKSIRDRLVNDGFRLTGDGFARTNAFTSFHLPEGVPMAEALNLFHEAQVGARGLDSTPPILQLAHAGYMHDAQVERFYTAGAALLSTHRTADVIVDRAGQDGTALRSVEAPFTIPASEFVAQVQQHARKMPAGVAAEKVAQAAKRIFRNRHVVHEEALRHRRVGFVGAGRIARKTVELCLARGITNLTVYSPAMAAGLSDGHLTLEQRQRRAEWEGLPVAIASTLAEVFTTAHAVVLLPVVYDGQALRLFRKGPEYRNHRMVDGDLLAKAEAAGRLDLIINAAARDALIDRPALTRAVEAGWLRYYSDEMPAAGDPLLACEGVWFTGHVGGSCAAPQAAVARNTHRILRHALAQLRGAPPPAPESDEHPPNVINAHLLTDRAAARMVAAVASSRSDTIRVLLTDPFDVASLSFDRLRETAGSIEVHDVSAERLSPAALGETIRAVRPHILMLRSRTKIDDGVASSITGLRELAFVIRPGVGVDNLYAGMERLSEAGIQIINEPHGNSFAVAEMALHFILAGTETTLMAPGPTKFNPQVFDVVSDYDPTNPSSLRQIQASVDRTIGDWLASTAPAVTLSGPGTALMEASIANLTRPGSRGLIISHGKFGDRFVEIAHARRRVCDVLRIDEADYGNAIAPEQLERVLADAATIPHRPSQAPYEFLCFQQNETSSGVTYREEAIGRLVRAARTHNPALMVIVDAISGAFAHRLRFDALDVDALFLGSQKALGVSSGLAFGVFSERARDAMVERSGWRGTFEALCESADRDRYLAQYDRLQQVHSTNLLRALVRGHRRELVDEPSIFHLLSTARALELFAAEGGVEAVVNRHARLARMAREGVQKLGLETMARPPYDSDSVTVAVLPEGVSASAVRKSIARESAIEVAGAQGDYWKPRMIRIGTLGFVSESDVVRCIRALARTLEGPEQWPANASNSSDAAVPTPAPLS